MSRGRAELVNFTSLHLMGENRMFSLLDLRDLSITSARYCTELPISSLRFERAKISGSSWGKCWTDNLLKIDWQCLPLQKCRYRRLFCSVSCWQEWLGKVLHQRELQILAWHCRPSWRGGWWRDSFHTWVLFSHCYSSTGCRYLPWIKFPWWLIGNVCDKLTCSM